MPYFDGGRIRFRYHGGWDYESWEVGKIAKINSENKALAILKYTPNEASAEQISCGIFNCALIAGNGVPLINNDNISASINNWMQTNSLLLRGSTITHDGTYIDPTIENMYEDNGIYQSELYVSEPTFLPPYPYSGYWIAFMYTDTDLPIFNVNTQAGIDAFNLYQVTGDYSGAENYNDLPQISKVFRQIYFNTKLKGGIKGNKGNVGAADEVPTGAIIAYDGVIPPAGYEITTI